MKTPPLKLTANAIERLMGFRNTSDTDLPLILKVTIDSGGCSGFQYRFDLISSADPKDHLFTQDGVQVSIDDVSLQLIDGAEIDYVEEMIGSHFVIRNPNASASCGCGNSFSI